MFTRENNNNEEEGGVYEIDLSAFSPTDPPDVDELAAAIREQAPIGEVLARRAASALLLTWGLDAEGEE